LLQRFVATQPQADEAKQWWTCSHARAAAAAAAASFFNGVTWRLAAARLMSGDGEADHSFGGQPGTWSA
jgi:hypothetical protein